MIIGQFFASWFAFHRLNQPVSSTSSFFSQFSGYWLIGVVSLFALTFLFSQSTQSMLNTFNNKASHIQFPIYSTKSAFPQPEKWAEKVISQLSNANGYLMVSDPTLPDSDKTIYLLGNPGYYFPDSRVPTNGVYCVDSLPSSWKDPHFHKSHSYQKIKVRQEEQFSYVPEIEDRDGQEQVQHFRFVACTSKEFSQLLGRAKDEEIATFLVFCPSPLPFKIPKIL